MQILHDEAARQHQLDAMKRRATALLIIATAIFIAATALQSHYGWLAIVRAFTARRRMQSGGYGPQGYNQQGYGAPGYPPQQGGGFGEPRRMCGTWLTED